MGPAIAGLVVATFGSVYALWVAAALFGLAAVIVATTLTNPVPDPREPGAAGAESYLQRLRQGADFLRGEGMLRAIAAMVAVTNLLDQAFIAVLLPVWARASGYGPEAMGLVVSIFGAASVIAARVAAGTGDRLPRRAVYLIGFVIGGVPRFAAMALGIPLWAVLAVLAVGGLGSGFINPIIGAVTYERIPPALLGRVKTLTQALAWSWIPFGGLLGAALVTLAGLSGALWIVGGCYLVAFVLPGMRWEWSQMGRPPDHRQLPYQHGVQLTAKGCIKTPLGRWEIRGSVNVAVDHGQELVNIERLREELGGTDREGFTAGAGCVATDDNDGDPGCGFCGGELAQDYAASGVGEVIVEDDEGRL